MRRKKVKTEAVEANPMVDDEQPSTDATSDMNVEASVACPKCEAIFSGQQVLDADGTLTPIGVSSWDTECPKCGEAVSYRSPTDGGKTSSPPAGEASRSTADSTRSERASRNVEHSRGGDGGSQLADDEVLSGVGAPLDKPDEVTVCWGEEKFFPDPNDRYSSVVAGSVFFKTSVRSGETPVQAAERAWKIARAIGRKARDEKVDEFGAKLKDIRDQYR